MTLSLLVLFIGAVLFLLCTPGDKPGLRAYLAPKLVEIGRIMMFAGLLSHLLSVGSRAIR